MDKISEALIFYDDSSVSANKSRYYKHEGNEFFLWLADDKQNIYIK